MASPVAIPVAIVMLMMVAPVMVTVMPLPVLSLTGGCLIFLRLSLRLALFARRRSIWLTVPVVMRPMPAALTTPLTAWTAMMAPFTLAFRVLKLGFRSTETPDFLEFWLGVFGGRAICRLRGYSVRRHPRWLARRFGRGRSFRRRSPLFNCRDCRRLSAGLILPRTLGCEGGLDAGFFRSLRLGCDL